MDVEGAAARRGVAGRADTARRPPRAPAARRVDLTLPRVHHAPGEQVDVVARRPQRLPAHRQVGGEPDPLGIRRSVAATASDRRARPQQAGVRQGARRRAAATDGVSSGVSPAFAGPLHQLPERHAARAGRLTAPALHARLEARTHLPRRAGAVVVCTCRISAIRPRGERPRPRDPERRAVRQAQPALHAHVQLVGVDPEVHVIASPGRDRGSAGRSDRTRASRVRRQCRTVGSSRARRGAAKRTPSRLRSTPRTGRGGRRQAAGSSGWQRPAVRRARRAGRRLLEPCDPREPSTSARRRARGPRAGPTWCAVPEDGGDRSTTPRTANGSASGRCSHSRTGGQGLGAKHHLASRPERPERAHQQPREVEAGDVLDRRATPRDDPPVGRHVADLQRGVAHRPPPSALDVVLAHGERATDGAAPVGKGGALTSHRRVRRGAPRRSCRPDADGHLLRAGGRARRRELVRRARRRLKARRRATGSATLDGDRTVSTDLGREADNAPSVRRRASSPHPRRHGTQRLDVATAVRAGRTLPRLSRHSGSNASRSRLVVEVGRRRTSDPCTRASRRRCRARR